MDLTGNETIKTNSLGEHYPLTDVKDATSTKERILIESVKLFAKHSYAAVSVKEIAAAVDVKAASIYNHFEGKDHLWEEVVAHLENLYLMYFARLKEALILQETFEDVLDCMFIELLEVDNLFTFYGFSMIETAQFSDDSAGKVFRDIYLKYSIDFIKREFDLCVERGLVSPFDTDMIATLFMHSVIIGNHLRIHEDLGNDTPYDTTKMFRDLRDFFMRCASAGI